MQISRQGPLQCLLKLISTEATFEKNLSGFRIPLINKVFVMNKSEGPAVLSRFNPTSSMLLEAFLEISGKTSVEFVVFHGE